MHEPELMPMRLAAFLAEVAGSEATVESYEPLVGGYSRVMACASGRWRDGAVERLVLRGDPPPGTGLMETDRDVEWALLTALHECGQIPLPKARWYDSTGEHLGTKCIVIDHVDGPSLQTLLGTAADDDLRRHADDLVDTLARIHTVEPHHLSGADVAPTQWHDYIGRLIDRFRQADAGHVEPVPFLRYVAAWLDAHRPPPLPLRLVHSDFQPANLMVDRDGSHLVIDWELAHIGDPREDLGYYNVYSSSSGPNLFMLDPERFLSRYRERTGFGEDTVNMETMAYFSSLAAVTVYAQVLGGAAAMALGRNGGLMTTYTINALTIGHNNFMRGCREWAAVR